MLQYLGLISTALFLAFVISGCSGADTVRRAKEVKKGMSIQEVKQILGEPSDSLPGYFDKSKIMFVYKTALFESDDVQIYFEPESKTVTNIVLPKGE